VAGKQAKILSVGDVNDLLVFANCTRHSLRNCVIVLLAAKAGLRASEIAKLTWDMVLDPTGDIGPVIELRDVAAKNGSGRLIPVHPDLRHALAAYRSLATRSGPLIRSQRGGPMTPLSIVVWFNRAFRNIGLHGCSSHSGRRTFITRRRGWSTKPAARCAMSSCSLVTDRSKQLSGTSTATLMCSASWSP
jgi:integrase/recombinase XerD